MATAAADITFVVPGRPSDTASGAARGTLRGAVRVGTRRGGAAEQRLVARPGRDVVVLTVADGPTLVLHPEDARDLLRAQDAGATDAGATRGSAAAATASNEVRVSAELGWPGLEAAASRSVRRGWLGRVWLSALEVVTGDGAADAVGAAADFAAAAVTRRLDGQVEAGVYALDAQSLPPLKERGGRLDAVPPAPDGQPLLVLVHGTFVDTASTFGKLWALHAPVVQRLFERYGARVYALDHPTLGASPVANALTLVRALPAGARLHLLTHSRGGLVAEVLARLAGGAMPDADGEGGFTAAQRAELQALADEVRAKRLVVERMVRVACPARGTLLASKRLDAYLSVLKWGLELAQVPVAPALVDFLSEVAQRRADPAVLPGLQAMMPDSPLVRWLNAAPGPELDAVAGQLRVVAGDIEGDSIVSWVKTLLADAFFWTDNDLVVQTRSMYGGTPRAGASGTAGASFMLAAGGAVSHFRYFAEPRTVEAVAAGLLEENPAAFRLIGPLSWAGRDASGSRAARAVARSRGGDDEAAAARPAVIVLPGILGSNLALDGKRIWLGLRFFNRLKDLTWDPATAARVTPDGPIALVYDDLVEHLAASHEVIPFAFDWRRPIEDEARRLGDVVDAALGARNETRQPVRLLAHSMGGLVARTLQLERPDVWDRLMGRDGARLLMLGTPNAGSWAPMQVLSGDDTFGNTLVSMGALFDDDGARRVMAGMPGFLQLQAALLDPALGLDRADAWQRMADEDLKRLRERSFWHADERQLAVYRWGAPPQAVLDQAVALRRRLDAQAASLGAGSRNLLLVVGRARFTPAGAVLGDDGLEYLDAPDGGDGRVTLASALLPGVRTWQCEAAHGDLPDHEAAFDAYVDLLAGGDTARLPRLEAEATRGAVSATGAGAAAARSPVPAALVRNRPSRGARSAEPPSLESDIFAPQRQPARQAAVARPALRIEVLNGDLKYVGEPLLVGHYRALALTGTEWVVNALIGGVMVESLSAGLYPDAVGEQQVFVNQRRDPDNPWAMPRPLAVVVAGLGEEGKLRPSDLVHTVRQAVIAYGQRAAEQAGAAPRFELAATLIGSGGTGISPGTSAQMIVQGVREANERLQRCGWPLLGRLTLVELYLERAGEAWRALQVQAATMPGAYEVVGPVRAGTGALRRQLESGYRGTAYDLITAVTEPGVGDESRISYTLDTRRARTEVRAQSTQGKLLRELIAHGSTDTARDRDIGRTLFKLLVPVEMEPFLGGTTEMVIELDGGTAGIPWELLVADDRAGADPRPWAVRCKLLRKLRTSEFRAAVADAAVEDHVLVIGEPLVDAQLYPPLPGARAEAVAVYERLTGAQGVGADRVRALVSGQDDARSVINALLAQDYRVVHVAGHGEPGARGGVVLSGGTVLGPFEVEAMRKVPELVFLNCCHLAAVDRQRTLVPFNRATFAAGIAEALIKLGVRCVIAAGWAVEDGPAAVFATRFYDELLRGGRFIDAVAAAREACWRASPEGNTWAAYQCYGDPAWTWRREGQDAQRPSAPPGDEYAGIGSAPGLALALETLAVASRYGGADEQSQRFRVGLLEARFAPLWGGMGAVAEAFAVAWAETREVDRAIDWYRRAEAAADASASYRTGEQLADLLARRGERGDDAAAARRDLGEAIDRLARLAATQPTLERERLLGAAHKRLSMVEGRVGRRAAAAAALQQAVAHLERAAAMARDAGDLDWVHAARSALAARLRLALLRGRAPAFEAAELGAVREAMRVAADERPDFRSVVGVVELRLLEAVAAARLAPVHGELVDDLHDLKTRVPSPALWDGVATEARFVLEAYAARGAEAQAKQHVLDTLAAMKA